MWFSLEESVASISPAIASFSGSTDGHTDGQETLLTRLVICGNCACVYITAKSLSAVTKSECKMGNKTVDGKEDILTIIMKTYKVAHTDFTAVYT